VRQKKNKKWFSKLVPVTKPRKDPILVEASNQNRNGKRRNPRSEENVLPESTKKNKK